jgi:hypothetical protein
MPASDKGRCRIAQLAGLPWPSGSNFGLSRFLWLRKEKGRNFAYIPSRISSAALGAAIPWSHALPAVCGCFSTREAASVRSESKPARKKNWGLLKQFWPFKEYCGKTKVKIIRRPYSVLAHV